MIIIVGPTAVGKSALGICLAKMMDGEIISGDSVQIYKKLNIGSAKPSLEERQGVPHHLLDELDLTEEFSVSFFQLKARECIGRIRGAGKMPIVVGGTGLYIRSLTDDYDFTAPGSQRAKAYWEDFAKKSGPGALHQRLSLVDPVSAGRLHQNDMSRIIRALEVYELTGRPFSEQRDYKEREYPPLPANVVYVGLEGPRSWLYDRINLRCQVMLKQGLFEETANVLREGYNPALKPLQSIGYRHAVWHLRGKTTYEETIRLFQRDTRHFAKRQLTWFRRDPRLQWYDVTSFPLEKIAEKIAATCREMESHVK